MKKTLILLSAICLAVAFLFSCKKNAAAPAPVITSFSPVNGAPGIIVNISGQNFDSAASQISVSFNGTVTTPFFVNDSTINVYVPAGTTTGKITVTVNGRSVTSSGDFTILPGNWQQVAAGSASPLWGRGGGVSAAINNKGYFGLGSPDGGYLNDLWEFDPATGAWTQKASAPIGLFQPFWMVINNKLYLGTGVTDDANAFQTSKFFEYDPATDTWTEKADYPGQTNYGGIALGIGNYGYAGLGANRQNTSPNVVNVQSWWQYNPANDTWVKKNDFPGPSLLYSVGFTINGVGYLGTSNYSESVTWWQYDASADAWTRKKDYPGSAVFAPSGMVVGTKGYVIGGNECWQYDPLADNWVQVAFCTNNVYGGAFGIGNFGYFVGGQVGALPNTTWQFTPPQ